MIARPRIWNADGVEKEIIGETKQSWLVGPRWKPEKVNKKDPNRGCDPDWPQWFLDEALMQKYIADSKFLSAHAYKIQREVGYLRNADKLREIAKIIGYSYEGTA